MDEREKSSANFFVTTEERANTHNHKAYQLHLSQFLKRNNNNPMLMPLITNYGRSAGAKMLLGSAQGRFARELREFMDAKLRPTYVSLRSMLQYVLKNMMHTQRELGFRPKMQGTQIRAVRVTKRQTKIDHYILKKIICRENKERDGEGASSSDSSSATGSDNEDNEVSAGAATSMSNQNGKKKRFTQTRVKSELYPGKSKNTIVDKNNPFIRIVGRSVKQFSSKHYPQIGYDRKRLTECRTPFYAAFRYEQRQMLKNLLSRPLVYCEICRAHFEDVDGRRAVDKRHPDHSISHVDSEIHKRNVELLQTSYDGLDALLSESAMNQPKVTGIRHQQSDIMVSVVKHEPPAPEKKRKLGKSIDNGPRNKYTHKKVKVS